MITLMTVLVMTMGAEAVNAGSASLTVHTVGAATGDRAPAPRVLDLDLERAFVTQGSYSGLRMTFRSHGDDESYDQLVIFIPSHEGFAIDFDSSSGRFRCRIPEFPFTLTAAETSGLRDRRGRPRPLQVELSHWQPRAKDHWSQQSILLTSCGIEISSLAVDDGTLRITGTFYASSPELTQRVAGRFTVFGSTLGISKVD